MQKRKNVRGFLLYEGTYEEWANKGYPSNYRTYIMADTTTGIRDTENDSILVYAGDDFDDEIWITDNDGNAIKDWDWLHDAEAIEGNIAVFEITLTRFTNDSMSSKDKFFVFRDPKAISAQKFYQLFGTDMSDAQTTKNDGIMHQDDEAGIWDGIQEELEEESNQGIKEEMNNDDVNNDDKEETKEDITRIEEAANEEWYTDSEELLDDYEPSDFYVTDGNYLFLAGSYLGADIHDIVSISIFTAPSGDGTVGNINFRDSTKATLWDDANGKTLSFSVDGKIYGICFVDETTFDLMLYDELTDACTVTGRYKMVEHYVS